MNVVTINITDRQYELFKALKEGGLIVSRSEGLRTCITIGIEKLFRQLKLIEDVQDKIKEEEEFIRVPLDSLDDNEKSRRKPLSFAELRKQFPVLKDYKFINERVG